jgi:prevent-host-death family protein
MSTYSVAGARAHFTEVLDQAQHEAVMIERHGKQAAVVISPEHYELLMEAFEDAEDVQSFDDAMTEEGANIPWEQVKVDLGWV